jgi:uncharacterized membrane protein
MSTELDDLKSIWKSNAPFQAKQAQEISAMLKGSSKSIIAKLKKSVWFELIFTVVTGLVMLYYSFTIQDGPLKWSIVSILILFLAYIVYYVKKINLLNSFNPSHQNVRENLEKLVNDLDAYVRFYKRSYTLMYPVYFVLGLFFAAMEKGIDKFLNSLVQPSMILRLVFIAAVFLIAALVVSNWYVKKLYGNHLEKLRSLLNDVHDLPA